MRGRVAIAVFCMVFTGAWAKPAAPFEIVKDHTEIEVSADGSDVSSREQVFRILDARGIAQLHERRFAIARKYEDLQIIAAYTLKAGGQRIDVPKSGMLSGFGQTSAPGFQDNVNLSIFFPNLEVGDSVVLSTVHRQFVPWFAGRYDYRVDFSKRVPARDVSIAVTAPAAMGISYDDAGLTAAPVQTIGAKMRRVWSFHNETVEPVARDAVSELDFAPHLVVTSFKDYADVAHAYDERAKPAATITPEIAALADQLTQGVADRRQQVKLLYDWVSSHISYVAIVLGAGGFTPHDAKDVLANLYGDCKDHVVLLEALLKAKDIDSTAALIRIGERSFVLPKAAMAHAFDHVITYVPEFDLYLDSTAGLAPFGVLPYADAGKPVLNVASGVLAKTPVTDAASSTIVSVGEVRIDKEGAADATVTITAKGAIGVELRDAMRQLEPGEDDKYLSDRVGAGTEGTLEHGDPSDLSDPYVLKARYRLPGAINMPGPGALRSNLVFRLLSFSQLVAYDLPPDRATDYLCTALGMTQQIHYSLPPGFRMLFIPESEVFTAEGLRLQLDYDRPTPSTLDVRAVLKLSHPAATCTPDYYARNRAAMARMLNALKAEVIYRGPKEGAE